MTKEITGYKNKYFYPEEYVRDAFTNLEDAEYAMELFIDKADPQNEDAETLINAIDDIRSDLKKFIKEHEAIFEEIISKIP